jgi:uncharacterized protein YndB with AHSA1/START domain
MVDVKVEVNAIAREVGTGRIAAGDGKTVRLRRTYNAGIDDVWDALTSPQRIGRWFLPISGDLRLGGSYQFQGNAGGEIVACEKPNRLLVTWVYGSEDPSAVSEVEIRLTAEGDGATIFEMAHTAVVPDEMWDTFGPGAVGVGWDMGLLGLSMHLNAGDEPATPAEKEAWQLSDEGRDFAKRSSEAWGGASRAAGVDDETVARNVAATTEFYAPSAATAE